MSVVSITILVCLISFEIVFKMNMMLLTVPLLKIGELKKRRERTERKYRG